MRRLGAATPWAALRHRRREEGLQTQQGILVFKIKAGSISVPFTASLPALKPCLV